MILRKIIINDKEVYEPISKEDALKLDDKSILTFTSEDEEDEFEELLEEMEDSEDDEEPFVKVGGVRIINKHKKHSKKGSNKIIALLPFMEDEEIHKIVESILNNSEDYKDLPLVAVMPFLSDEDCDALFMKFVVDEKYQDDIELSSLAPFVSDENEAATVREIYRMFLVEGMTPGGIAKELNRRGIKTARQKDSWSKVGLMSILTNEKYKGDALLQKGYVENFLEHKTIKNNGVLPQYYVENSHPYIIEKEMWELVQLEIERRNKIGAAYSASDIFAAKLICEDCGGFYGRKVWHSGSKYQTFIYQCNRKFDKSTKKYNGSIFG